jgi:predicted ABC-type exoprotein transport system permease subunit
VERPARSTGPAGKDARKQRRRLAGFVLPAGCRRYTGMGSVFTSQQLRLNEGETMTIWTILFIILLIAWIGGFTVFHVASGLIHLLLVFAVISLILHFVLGTRTV